MELNDICVCGGNRLAHATRGMGPGLDDCRSFRLASHTPSEAKALFLAEYTALAA